MLGTGSGSFSTEISYVNLEPNTTYYFRAYATNSNGTTFGSQETFTTTTNGFPCIGTPIVIDHEGNEYNTVQIGNQCWTRENMRCATSPNGYLRSGSNSLSDYVGYYYNLDTANIPLKDRGFLYNWLGAMDATSPLSVTLPRRGICPEGWHVPSFEEFDTLTNYVANHNYCLGCSYSQPLISQYYWMPYQSCTNGDLERNNASGFSLIPSGEMDNTGLIEERRSARLWSSSYVDNMSGTDGALSPSWSYISGGMSTNINWPTSHPCSVRCLKDN